MARTPGTRKRRRVPSFLAGSVLGGLVVLAAPRARRRRHQLLQRGLGAFEGAPCFDARPDGSPSGEAPTDSGTPAPPA
jgi:hypothetical protein